MIICELELIRLFSISVVNLKNQFDSHLDTYTLHRFLARNDISVVLHAPYFPYLSPCDNFLLKKKKKHSSEVVFLRTVQKR